MDISGRTAAAIAESVERGLLARPSDAGDALPTIRELSTRLGVSPATVAAAYKLLRFRGLASGKGRQGTRAVVRHGAPARVVPLAPPGTRDLSTGGPDLALLPSLESALLAVRPRSGGYHVGPDSPDLIAHASAELEADGIPAHAVAVLSGGLDAIERVLREHLQAGDGVALEDPSLPGIVDLVSHAGYAAVPFAVDDEGPVPTSVEAALNRGCQAIIVTPRAQDPTGAAIGSQRAEKLRLVLDRFPRLVLIENDHAGPVAGSAVHTLGRGSRAHWAVVRSLSKFLGADLRVALLAGDEVTVARVRGRHMLGARWVSHVLQALAVTLWVNPTSGRQIARAGEIYAQRRLAAVAALEAHGISASGRSGLNVWVPVRHEGRVARALAERGWAVAPGASFRIQSGPGIRITTSTLVPEDAERFAADLAASLGFGSARLA